MFRITALLLVFALSGVTQAATPPCQNPLLDPLERLIEIEQRIGKLRQASGVIASDPKVQNALNAAEQALDAATNSLGGAPDNSIEKLDYAVTKIEDDVQLLKRRESTTDFKAAEQDPRVIKAWRPYEVEGLDPHLKHVIFSEEVLEGVFWNESSLMQRAAQLIFRGLQRGRQYATDKSGVVQFESDRSVFKVKIIGDAVGAVRVAGFFVGEDFYIVSWSGESSHGDAASGRLINRVNNYRDRLANKRR